MELSLQSTYSTEEQTQIVNLFTNEFPGDKGLLKSKFELIINSHPNLKIIVCKGIDGEIVSAMFILESVLNFEVQKLNLCSLSFFATKPKFRRGEASKLMREFVRSSILPKYDLVIGFPRHIMQGYWGKNGFIETTNSAGRKIDLTELVEKNDSNYFWQSATVEDIRVVMDLHHRATDGKKIKYLRSFETWIYLFKLSGLTRNKILLCKGDDSRILSYAVIQGETIIEISHIDNSNDFLLNTNLLHNSGCRSIFLSLRGMLSGDYWSLTQFASINQLDDLLTTEDKWDFMVHAKDFNLKEYIVECESSKKYPENFAFGARNGNLFSTFSILDVACF
jgi:hypothetical protein